MPAREAGEALRLSSEPVLDIGAVDGDPRYQLFRVSGATRLSDGRIVVSNAGTHELRFYDAAGRHLRSVGGRGEGPGEFEALARVWPYRGDSLVVFDPRLQRLSVFTANGDFVRVARVERGGLNPEVWGVFDDGSLFLVDMIFSRVEEGPRDQHANYIRVGADGALVDSLGRFPTFRSYRVRGPGGGFITGGIFARRTAVAGGAAAFFVGLGRDYEVDVYAPDGAFARRIRWAGPPREVTDDDVETLRAEYLADADDENERRLERRRFEQLPVADRFPAYEWLSVDRAGRLWVRAYDRPGEEPSVRWDVFDADGRWLGPVELPPDLFPLEIGADYVLASWRDELDVAHVRVYRLTGP